MNRKSVWKGLILLTLLMVVGAEHGLIGPRTRPAVSLVQEVRAGAAESPSACPASA